LGVAAASLRIGGHILVWDSGGSQGSAKRQMSVLVEMGFEAAEIVADTPVVAVTVAVRMKKAVCGKRSTDAWREQVKIKLPFGSKPEIEVAWTILPGLFAGGALDVMTEVLLRALPQNPPGELRVLDYACGSGVIGAAALRHCSGVEVTMLDADAVAIEACRANVPDARRIICSDGWRGLEQRKLRFDWILSNPPVHRGRVDDFAVLMDLVRGAGPRLRAGGSLWIVAQEHVPVGALLGCFQDVTCPFDDGRFVVWKASSWLANRVDEVAWWDTYESALVQLDLEPPTKKRRRK